MQPHFTRFHRFLSVLLLSFVSIVLLFYSTTSVVRADNIVIGDGTPAKCTEAALDQALAVGGVIVFACGDAPYTMTLSSEKVIVHDTILYGGRVNDRSIIFSAGQNVRIFRVPEGVHLELSGIILRDGLIYTDRGAAILNAGVLELFNTAFINNQVVFHGISTSNGGAIYNTGSLTVSNSLFYKNHGSIGGAIYIGLLTKK
jgi:hypothetical protein